MKKQLLLFISFKKEYILLEIKNHIIFCSEVSILFCYLIDIFKSNISNKKHIIIDIKKNTKKILIYFNRFLYEEAIIIISTLTSFLRILYTLKQTINNQIKFQIEINNNAMLNNFSNNTKLILFHKLLLLISKKYEKKT